MKLEVVKAGAGAGKTTHLTHRVVSYAKAFHAEKGEWPRLVVTTFTRKATQELRERLITIGLKDGDPRLLEFLSSSSGLMISTLHGVFSSFLRKYGHLCEVDPSFALLSEGEASRLAKTTMRKVLFDRPDVERLLSRLTLDRWTALAREFERLWTGGGDLRPAGLVDFQSATRRIFFSLGSDLQEALARIPATSWGSDYLSFLHQLTAELKAPNSSPENIKTALGAIGRKPPFRRDGSPFEEDLHDDLVARVERVKKELVRPEYNEDHWGELQEFLSLSFQVFVDFAQKMREAKGLRAGFEMSDLENLTLEKLKKEPSLGELFSRDWDFWLIDEYQDTSPIQVEILERLVGQSPVYIVGDPQQSIYLFRGARSEVFEQIEQRALSGASDGTSVVSELAVNYRSTPALLRFLNFAFSKFGDQFRSMLPNPKGPSDPLKVVARFVMCEEPKDGDSNSPSDVQPFQLRSSESPAVYQEICRLLDQNVRFEDICILGRTNRVLRDIENDLVSLGFPVQLYGSGGFWSRRDVMDGICLLRFLLNPEDNENLIQLLRSPWFRVPDQLLSKALRERPQSYWRTLNKNLSDAEAISRLQALLDRSNEQGVLTAFEAGVLESGMIDASAQIDSTGQREASLWKLIDLCRERARRSAKGLMELAQSRDISEGLELESEAVAALEPNRIQMMTVHAAKGLKFRHVVVVGAGQKPRLSTSSGVLSGLSVFEERSLSHPVPGPDDEVVLSPVDRFHLLEMDSREVREHQRLFYVALTRAVESVAVVWRGKPDANSWMDLLKIDLSEGEHASSEFRYLVEVARSVELKPYSLKRTSWGLRPKYAPLNRAPRWGSTSVTQVVSPAEQFSHGAPAEILKRASAAQRGTEIHASLFRLKDHYSQGSMESLSSDLTGPDRENDEHVGFILGITHPPMREILKHGHAEWGFQWRHEDKVIEGQIDLWATLPNGITWVVDYKSGSSKKTEGALKQIGLYAQALRAGGVKGPIWGALIYLADRKVLTELLEK